MENLEDTRKLLSEVRNELLEKPNVTATGVGFKVTEGKATQELALICSVETKKSKQSLTERELIPATIQNVPTDVYTTGVIYAFQNHTDRIRPAPGGISIGHKNITAGTFGCLVKKNGKLYILSNNHVLANSNNADIGDAILQPGPYDGGQSARDQIAKLSEFIPIVFPGENGDSDCPFGKFAASLLNWLAGILGSKTRLQSTRIQATENLVDAAIAEPLNPNDVKNEILEIGKITGIDEAALGMAVKKSGRTTGFTTGSIIQIDVTTKVNYGTNKVATFVDQVMAGAMSQGGDSGSAILNDQNELVGLLFAGSSSVTIINRIQNVFDALHLSLP